MKRLFSSIQRIWQNMFSEPNIETLSGKETAPNLNEPKVVISSKNDDSIGSISSKFARSGSESKTYRKLVTQFLLHEPRAKGGFTTIELHKWMDRSIPMSALSKTLYKMKLYGILENVIKDGDGRARIWKLASIK
jgi:hypothetical protein